MTSLINESVKKDISFRDWLPVFGLAFSVFIFNTSEFIPIGLLSDISKDLDVSEAKTGLLISAYAWVVALVSLPLMLLCAKIEQKKLLSILLLIFVLNNLLSFIATNYTILLISRLGIACAHAVFWSIIPPLAVQLAPEGQRSKALGFVAIGSSVAMVLGLPIGRIIGLVFGWRATFLAIAIVSALILIVLHYILPKVPSKNAILLRSLPGIFKRPSLVGLYILTALVVVGHFTAYSYIEPFIINGAGFSANFATLILLVFGGAVFIGSMLFSKFSERYPYQLMLCAVAGIAFSMLFLKVASVSVFSIIVVCILWSVFSILFNLLFQIELMKIAPEATAIAMSVYSGTYNLGIGSGAFIGGIVVTHLGVLNIGLVGGAIGLIAFFFCYYMVKRHFGRN